MAVTADQMSNALSSTVPQKLKGNYSLVKGIEILDSNNLTNTSNTFNTFWKGMEGNGIHNNGLKSGKLTNSEQKTIENE
jgi:hypothetical protein